MPPPLAINMRGGHHPGGKLSVGLPISFLLPINLLHIAVVDPRVYGSLEANDSLCTILEQQF